MTSCSADGLSTPACAIGVQVRMNASFTWSNGTAENCASAGLTVQDRSEAEVKAVRIARPRQEGIRVADTSRVVVRDCVVAGAGGAGISVSGRSRVTADRCVLSGNEGPSLECDATSVVTGDHADDVTMTASASGHEPTDVGRSALGSSVKVSPPAGRTRGELMAELDGLVGLAEVKEQVARQVRAVEVEIRRRQAGLKVSPSSRHLVFVGPAIINGLVRKDRVFAGHHVVAIAATSVGVPATGPGAELLPRRFRSSAPWGACGAGRLAIDRVVASCR